MRTAWLAIACLLAAACEQKADPALVAQNQKLAGQVDDLAMEIRGMARKLDEVSRQLAEVSGDLEAMSSKLDAAPTRAPQPPAARTPRPVPDPKDVFAVPVDGDPADGPDDALVTIVEGYEYACPFCERVRPTLDQLRTNYGKQLRVVKKQFIVHPLVATAAAHAACAAEQQGKFAAMDALLWEKAFKLRKFDEAHLETLAVEAELDLGRYKADIKGMCIARVEQDMSHLKAVGQTGTPAFYINGRYLSGAQPINAFQAVIDQELELAEQRIAAGTKRRDYYQEWVLDRGKPSFVPPPAGP